jgi:hypothetical protein
MASRTKTRSTGPTSSFAVGCAKPGPTTGDTLNPSGSWLNPAPYHVGAIQRRLSALRDGHWLVRLAPHRKRNTLVRLDGNGASVIAVRERRGRSQANQPGSSGNLLTNVPMWLFGRSTAKARYRLLPGLSKFHETGRICTIGCSTYPEDGGSHSPPAQNAADHNDRRRSYCVVSIVAHDPQVTGSRPVFAPKFAWT